MFFASRSKVVMALALGFSMMGLAGVAKAAEARSTTVHLGGMTCQGCADTIAEVLGRIDGVKKVDASFDRGSAVVDHDETVASQTLVQAVIKAGYSAGLEKDNLIAPNLLEGYDEKSDVRLISKSGEDVDVTRHLAAGKVTIVDFFATWCVPCKAVDKRLQAMLKAEPPVAVRKLNVLEWSSPIAKRYLAKTEALPYLQVYDANGKLVAELTGGSIKKLEAAVREASAAK